MDAMETPKRSRTRRRLLEIGLKLAALEGFATLDLKRLSDVAGMSRSGILDVFSSVEEVRRAVLDCGVKVWKQDVIGAAGGDGGLSRLWSAWAFWLRHARALPTFLDLLPGFGDAIHPDHARVLARDVTALWNHWGSFVAASVKSAARAGEMRAPIDPFELHVETLSIASTLPWLSHLLGPPAAIERTAANLFRAINSRRAVPWPETEKTVRLRSRPGEPLGAELLGLSDLGEVEFGGEGGSVGLPF